MADILPDVIIIKILNYLSYDQLLVIRKMDVRFSVLVDYVINSNTVWLKSYPDDQFVYRSYITNEMIYHDYCLTCNSSISFQNNSDIYDKLKKLILYDINLLPEIINLNNLIQLEIYQITTLKKSKFIINALNLKFMTIFTSSKDLISKIILDTINLKYFKSNLNDKLNFSIFEFIYPKSLETLICYNNIESLDKFKNLKEFNCVWFKNLNINKLFSNLTYLNKFSFIYYESIQLNELLINLNAINNKLEIIYRGIKLNSFDPNNLDDLKGIKQVIEFTNTELEIYKNYIDLLDNLSFLKLNISDLNDLPLQIIKRLVNIKTLCINNDLENYDKLIEILKICRPRKIIIKVLVKERILNLINEFNFLNITELQIDDFNDISIVLNFRYLKYLKCGLFFDLNLFKQIIKQLKHICSIIIEIRFSIKINDDKIQFLKDDKIIFEEKQNVFINCTLESINYWSDLFPNLKY